MAYSFTDTTYKQNFDSLANTGTSNTWTQDTTLQGWSLVVVKGGTASASYRADDGAGSTGAFYSYGVAGSTDRALGALVSSNATAWGGPGNGELAGYIVFAATNNTSDTINSFTISYDGEQWRNGGTSFAQSMTLEYGFGSSYASVTTWVTPGGDFDWSTPVTGGTAGAVVGNVAGLAENRGGTVSSIDWTAGETLFVRWAEYRPASGSASGIAIDNFSLTVAAAPVEPPEVLITEVNSDATSGDFFELWNYGNTVIDLTGWKWTDKDGEVHNTFPDGLTLAAGARLLVLTNESSDANFRNNWELPENLPVLVFPSPGLGANPSSDGVVVVNGEGALVTAFNYSNQAFTSSIITKGNNSIAPASKTGGGDLGLNGHAGASFGGHAKNSVVWDSATSTPDAPTYKVASQGDNLGSYVHTTNLNTIGSPGGPFIKYSATTLTENASNDGGIATTLTLTLRGDTFKANLAGTYTVTNLPTGVTAELTRVNGTTVTLEFIGNADAHANDDEIDNLKVEFSNEAFLGNNAAIVFNAVKSDLVVDFIEPTLSYSTDTLNESAAYDGSVSGKIVITLSGDTFETDVADHVTVNAPSGLTPVVTYIDGTTVELSFDDQADIHDADLSNITIEFANDAFTTLLASGITGSNRTGLKIDFASENATLQPFKPNGQGSDASTALALDANYIVVGDDEASVLRVYHREGGPAIKEWNYAEEFAALALGTGELDLEGGTRIGNVFYFTGSSSNNKGGEDQASREKLFAVTITGTGAQTEFTPFDQLLDLENKLVAWDADNGNLYGFAASAADGVRPEAVNGFSIEGLTASQDGTKLLLGFRAPQTGTSTRDKALVLELKLDGDGKFVASDFFGAAHELNLGGRGIRSIEKSADDNGYLILAGPAGSASGEVTHDFRLFRWNGEADQSVPANQPVELDVDLDSLRDATGGSFESIVDVRSTAAGTWVQLLQDNGDTIWPGQSEVSKDLPGADQQFVGNWVQIGGDVTGGQGPQLRSALPADDATQAMPGADIVLRFDEGVKLAGSGTIEIRKADGTVVDRFDLANLGAAADRIAVAFNTVTITPDALLEVGESYTVHVTPGAITDHYGNGSAVIGAADLSFTVAAPHKLLITEVNSNASGGDFFELYNHGDTTIDLSGWQWTDSANADFGTFAAGTIIEAQGKLVVVSGLGDTAVNAFKSAWGLGSNVAVVAVGGPGLGGNDGVAVIEAASGTVVTGLNYGDGDFTIGKTTVAPLTQTGGDSSDGGHAGAAVGAGNKVSAVWDGDSTEAPQYKAASVDQDGAFGAPNGDGTGSPGRTEAPVGDVPDYTQDFSTSAGFNEFTTHSQAGSVAWGLSNGAASINAFNNGVNSDWLISKAFNLDDTSAEFLSFTTWTRYADAPTGYPQVVLKYSVNYTGTGDPVNATWQTLNYASSPSNSQKWTGSGPVDLSDISGKNVYFAFHYQSSASAAASWSVDDFKIESYIGPVVTITATDADKNEGGEGEITDFTFTVTRKGPDLQAETLNWAVTGSAVGAPVDAADFVDGVLPGGTVTFAAGATTATITVNVKGDSTLELEEKFTVTLSGGSSTILGGGTAQGTIKNDESGELITKISQIQGEGTESALVGYQVTIQGIVTGYASGLSGFYVQSTGADRDNNANTSEGIFVYYGGNTISGLGATSVGDLVKLTGWVNEYNGQTQITYQNATYTVVNADNTEFPAPVQIKLPVSSLMDWESVEGMLVEVSSGTLKGGSLVITDNFNQGQYGQLTLTSDEIQYQYTENNGPDQAGFDTYNKKIKLDQIILDDGTSQQNPATHLGRNGNDLSASNPLRAGDSVDKIVGIVDQFIDSAAGAHETSYRVQAIETVEFTGPDRPTTADMPVAVADAEIKVGAFNVLNYFTTRGSAAFNTPLGNQQTGRGANNDAEFLRQEAKIVEGILGLGADVVALNEIQNNGYGPESALQALVDALNTEVGQVVYDFVKGPFSTGGDSTVAGPGSDAIAVAIIYRTDKVATVGVAAVPDASYDAFSSTYGSRVPIAQTFQSLLDDEEFTVVTNHFKSKGSATEDQGVDSGDGQGSAVAARVRAAEQLAQWIATHPTGNADPDVLLLGDFNSYSKEDPLAKLEEHGYAKVSEGYSYSFDGLWGSLDHAFASAALYSSRQITGAWKWAINAEESTLLDYNLENKNNAQDIAYYAPDAYRSSDHNPLVIGLNLGQTAPPVNIAPSLSGLPGSAQPVTVGQAAALADFTVADADGDSLTVTLTPTNGSIGGLSAGTVNDVTVTATANGFTLVGEAGAISTLLADATFTAAAAGNASIAVSVDDGQGGTDSKTYSLTATAAPPVNSPPTLTGVPTGVLGVTVGQAAALADFRVSDEDGDALTVTLTPLSGNIGGLTLGSSSGAEVSVSSGVYTLKGEANVINTLLVGVTFTAALETNNSYIRVEVNDGRGGATEGFYMFNAVTGHGEPEPVNTAPTLTGVPAGAQGVTVGQAAALADFAVADANGDSLTVTLTPTNGSIGGLSAGTANGVTVTAIGSGFQLSGPAAALNALLAGATFKAAAAGSASIAVGVSDGKGGSASGSYALSAQNPEPPANIAPTLTGVPSGALGVTVGQAATLADFKVGDADGDVLTVTLTAANGSIGGLSAGIAGGVTVVATATGFSLQGAAAGINTLLAGATLTATAAGNASLAIGVSDGKGGSASGSYGFSATVDGGEEPAPGGTVGSDLLQGTEGDDEIDGGAGTDWLASALNRAEAALVRNADGSWQLGSGAEGSDQLTDVERLLFNDGAVALDVAGEGTAGLAARLIGALYGPERVVADPELFGQVLAHLDALGEQAFLQGLLERGVLAEQAGADTPVALLALLYRNVFGREATAEELAALRQEQIAAGFDEAQSIAFAARLAETAARAGLDRLAEEGIDFQVFEGTLLGTAGADHFHAGALAQRFDGLGGIDTLVYDHARTPLQRQEDGSWQVQGPQADERAASALWNVERLIFNDGAMALDLDGNAGAVARLLWLAGDGALAGRAWVGTALAHLDALGLEATAWAAVQSGLSARVAGGGSQQQLIDYLFTRVLGQVPSQAEVDDLAQQAQHLGWNDAQVLAYAAQLDLTAQRADLVGLAQQGLAYELLGA